MLKYIYNFYKNHNNKPLNILNINIVNHINIGVFYKLIQRNNKFFEESYDYNIVINNNNQTFPNAFHIFINVFIKCNNHKKIRINI